MTIHPPIARYLIIPGLAGSGPHHWQTYWEHDLPNASRVEMPDWNAPRRTAWVSALDRAIAAADDPPILVAHSLGCIAVAHWAALGNARIRGALLVAPPDLDRRGCPEPLRDFAKVPREPLRFPSRVVASDNDPFGALAWAVKLAFDWESKVTVMESAGHINSDSGLGRWLEGRELLHDFLDARSRAALDRATSLVRAARGELEQEDSRWVCRGID